MQGNRSRDTLPELELRRALRAIGLRGYRKNWRLPTLSRRTADVAWPGRRLAVFLDGCYWHGCARHSRPPRLNAEYWALKVAANQARDRDTDRELIERGWTVVRLWEHTPPGVAARIVEDVRR
jgi:DNA mismatch endonuclease (patch repair protein)